MSELEKYKRVVQEMYIHWVDLFWAIKQLQTWLIETEKTMHAQHGIPAEILKNYPVNYVQDGGVLNWWLPIAQCSFEEMKKRSLPSGELEVFAFNTIIIAIYQHWEDSFREKVWLELGLGNAPCCDLMWEVSYIRNSLVHKQWVGIRRLNKNKILSWFKEGDLVKINREKFDTICKMILAISPQNLRYWERQAKNCNNI